jgi:hypothetical protein
MTHSTEIDQLSASLVALGAEISNPTNSAINPFHKNRYAPLNDMLNYLRPLLAKHGLTVAQIVTGAAGEIGVETTVLHRSGQYISSVATIPIAAQKGSSLAQVAGSTISYIRRYAIAAALNIASEDDDDGNAGLHQSSPAPRSQPVPVQGISKAMTDELKAILSALGPDAHSYRAAAEQAYRSGDVAAFNANLDAAKQRLQEDLI